MTTQYGTGRDSTTCVSINETSPAADGLAPPSAAVGPGSKEICPFCEQPTARYEHSSSAGTRAESLCCGIPQEFIDNYDVYEGLPEPLKQAAIDRKKAEYDAMDVKDRENARRFRESLAAWHAKYDGTGLIKGD